MSRLRSNGLEVFLNGLKVFNILRLKIWVTFQTKKKRKAAEAQFFSSAVTSSVTSSICSTENPS